MRINGKITEIITSRALVSFGGFVELEGKEFEDMKNIFTYLSKEYVDSCIGKFNILPKTIMQTEIDEITKKLEPYNVTISILGFFY